MINDFNNIKSEKDRELYVEFRNILDNIFIRKIKEHDDKDHLFSECEIIFDTSTELGNMFSIELKKECKIQNLTEIEIIQNWINHNEMNMLMHIACLVILRKEYDKRK